MPARFLFIAIVICCPIVCLAQITPKQLLDQYEAASAKFTASTNHESPSFIAFGNGEIGPLKVPIKLYSRDNYTRIEMDLMGVTFINVTNDTLNWSLNPITNTHEFEVPDKDDQAWFNRSNTSDLRDYMDAGYRAEIVNDVRLDSLDVYELLVKKEGDEKRFYFDKTSFLMIGKKWDGVESYFLNYKSVGSEYYPQTYIDKGEDGDFLMRIESYDFNTPFNDSVFELSKEALEAYHKPKEKKVNYVQQHYDEGQLLREKGEYKLAIEAFNKGLKINPNDVNTLNVRGLAKIQVKDYYGAIADISKAIEFSPEEKYTFFNNLGLAKYYLNDYDGAKADYNKSLSLDSADAQVFSNMGLLMFRYQDYESVDRYFTMSINRDSTVIDRYYYRAIARAELNRHEEALGDYNLVRYMGGDTHDFHNYRGVTLYHLEQLDSAAVEFRNAIAGQPENIQYYFNLAEVYEIQELYDEAIEVYDSVIRIDSTEHTAYSSRALIYYYTELYTDAFRDINKAINLSSESAVYYDYRAYIKEEIGDYQGAVEDYTTSLNLEQDSNIYYLRGMAKVNLNNQPDACLDFKKASELGDENAKEALVEYCKLE